MSKRKKRRKKRNKKEKKEKKKKTERFFGLIEVEMHRNGTPHIHAFP